MAVGKQARGPLWADGQITARVRGPASSAVRIVRIRRPFALIGRHPGVDVRIDDPAVDARHALLLLDRRGVFGVDLLSETGTRFAGAGAGSAWLGVGDILEVAGHRVEILRLRVDGRAIDPPLCSDDPLAPAVDGDLASITLESLDAPGAPWMLGSPLAFLGRDDACAIRVEDDSASTTHCALARGPAGCYLIDLLGRRTLLNDRPVAGASALLDGDVLTVGQARFGIGIGPPARPRPARAAGAEIAIRSPGTDLPARLAADAPPGALMARLIGVAPRDAGATRSEILDAIRRLRSDTETLLDDQIDRIEWLDREIADLRAEVRGRRGALPPPAPIRLDLHDLPPRVPSAESAAWLLERLNGLEAETRSTWKGLLGRIASAVHHRVPSETPTGPVADPRRTPEDRIS